VQINQNTFVAAAISSTFTGNTLQVSVKKGIAELFGFQNKQSVEATVIDPDTAAAEHGLDFVEISFRDQFISRSDMWRLELSLTSTCLYTQKLLNFSLIRVHTPTFHSEIN